MQQKNLWNVFNSNDFSESEISRINDNLKLSHGTKCFKNFCTIWYVCYLKANILEPIPIKEFCRWVEKETSVSWSKIYSWIYMGKKRLKGKTIPELLSDPQYNMSLERVLEEVKKASEVVKNVS